MHAYPTDAHGFLLLRCRMLCEVHIRHTHYTALLFGCSSGYTTASRVYVRAIAGVAHRNF
eukprot:11534-Heterococcus_DN1.PRE.4